MGTRGALGDGFRGAARTARTRREPRRRRAQHRRMGMMRGRGPLNAFDSCFLPCYGLLFVASIAKKAHKSAQNARRPVLALLFTGKTGRLSRQVFGFHAARPAVLHHQAWKCASGRGPEPILIRLAGRRGGHVGLGGAYRLGQPSPLARPAAMRTTAVQRCHGYFGSRSGRRRGARMRSARSGDRRSRRRCHARP